MITVRMKPTTLLILGLCAAPSTNAMVRQPRTHPGRIFGWSALSAGASLVAGTLIVWMRAQSESNTPIEPRTPVLIARDISRIEVYHANGRWAVVNRHYMAGLEREAHAGECVPLPCRCSIYSKDLSEITSMLIRGAPIYCITTKEYKSWREGRLNDVNNMLNDLMEVIQETWAPILVVTGNEEDSYHRLSPEQRIVRDKELIEQASQ